MARLMWGKLVCKLNHVGGVLDQRSKFRPEVKASQWGKWQWEWTGRMKRNRSRVDRNQ